VSKLRLYEKYAAGSITKEAYIQQKAAADAKIAGNDEAIQRSHERMKELDSETSCSDEKLDAVCDQYADCKALTYELTHAFISAVYIYDLDNIEIVWKFKDFLNTSEGEAKLKYFFISALPVRISLRRRTSVKSWNAMRRTRVMKLLLRWQQTASPASIRKVS